MRQSFFNSFILLFTFLFSALAFSQTEAVFSSSEVMRLRVEGAWTELLKQRFYAPEVAKQARIPVKVVIENSDKSETLIYAEVGLRGNTSLSPLECNFPKYSLYFFAENVSGTSLAGREQLAVGSHCSYQGGNSQLYGRAYDGKSPLREALVYRFLEILEIPSFKTRPVMVQYIDSSKEEKGNAVAWNQAFLMESLKQFSQRMGYELVDEDSANQVDLGEAGLTDIQKLARVILFQEMIGNNDWKVNFNELPGVRQTWNMFLAKNIETSHVEVVPSDFDLSSAVTLLNEPASAPQETLKKLPPEQVVLAKTFYRSKRVKLFDELKSLKKLDPAGYQHIKTKLEQFFNVKLKQR